jgi:hypothetical protein
MEITDELIAKIVRAVIAALQAQGLPAVTAQTPAFCRTCGSDWREPSPAPAAQPKSTPEAGTQTVVAEDGRRMLITEEMVRRFAAKGCRRLRVPANALVTPLARDIANEKKLEIVRV